MKLVRPYFLPFILLALLLSACSATAFGSAPREIVIKIENMRFAQEEVYIKAGQPVTLRVVNQDGYAHAFDLDEFDIHVPLAANV
ncbi:MAG TPA: cupredoxin domain-containing protein, partial [Chloroflexota bacterium]|nr:cupredoxin domain-containing protein [Chloroflexota bacterium]